jgi:hypothetical protein
VPPSPSEQCAPAQNSQDGKSGNEPLGRRLSESKGVICPPERPDREMKVPPPDSGAKMPVIKPPNSAK